MRDFGTAGPRLLILDRNLTFARLLRSQLLNLGLRHLRLAETTEEARLVLGCEPIHAVLADAETGPMTTPAFIRAVRAGGVLDPFVPILVCSFDPTWRKIGACRDAGGNGFLAKPLSSADLRDKLRTVLLEPRRYVQAESYFGPERRKGRRPPYCGAERRTRGPGVQVSIPVPNGP